MSTRETHATERTEPAEHTQERRRRKPVRATTYDARRAAMARAVDQMFTDRDLTTREDA